MKFIVALALACTLYGCAETAAPVPTPEYDPTPYTLDASSFPYGFQTMPLPTDYPLTQQRVELGRMLFYEPALSRDGSQSCASCHIQADGLSDPRKYSVGIRGLEGTRQAMSIANLGWHRRGFFWDGRVTTLREQALMPIVDPLEMDNTLANAISALSSKQHVRDQFIRAYGSDSITADRMGIAMEQFMLTIVSGNSKWDKVQRGEATFNEQEERGRQLFFNEFDPTGKVKSGECFHCHGGPNFTNDRFMNNGLDDDASFKDIGREQVTSNPYDRAKFKVPTLRNIAVTAPYMHDGRFTTLEEVVRHYSSGVKQSSTVDILLQFSLKPGLGLGESDVADLVAFLRALTDESYLNNPRYAKP